MLSTAPSAAATSGQVATYRTVAAGLDITYSYTYDANGNILTVSDGTNLTTYSYDSANQLIREDNQAADQSYTWTYDNAGNILSFNTYNYTTGELGAATASVPYAYDSPFWGDLLTTYNGTAFQNDGVGNPVVHGSTRYSWEHGRQLKSMTKDGTTWNYTYNNAGLRTGRYVQNGTTYKYVYNGGQLMQMTKGSQTVSFAYDVSGTPLTMKVGENTYYYVTNIQGDVMALVGSNGQTVVSYAYTAYGVVTASGDATVIALNPLTYRGYVYDTETGLYYLQSRYYDPAVGRFINADVYTTTGQGFIGNNMFAYCGNNPVNRVDPSGYSYEDPITEEEWAIYNLAELLKALVENGAAWFAILMCRPICPVDAYRNTDTDARYGAPRSHGPHEGIDYYPSDSVDNAYNGGDGTPQPVRAMNDGYILSINKKYYGNTMSVKIDHGTYIAEYCEIQLSEAVYDAWTGDRYISQGEVIGTMLQTSSASCSWTIMLHLEITYKGKKINPTIAYYFKKGEYTK